MNNYIQVANLIRNCGTIRGRVKLQKIVHILQAMKHPFREEFGYLHHGPYSSDLKSEIDQLVAWRLVGEQETPAGEYERYDYSAGSGLDSLLEQVGMQPEPEWAEIARQLNEKQAQELEGISTILFLRSHGFTGQKLETRFNELKPHLAQSFDQCAKEASRLVPE